MHIVKTHIYLFVSIFILGCQSKGEISENNTLSLNGNWKFHTIYGEGSNYMNVKAAGNDIVIDNKDTNVEIHGKWDSSNKGIRYSKFHGEDYIKHNFPAHNLVEGKKKDDAYVRFYPNFNNSGYFEAFAKFPFESHLTAQYNIKHADGITTKYVSQRVFCNEWISLGIYKFDFGDKNYVELTAIAGGRVAADAVMFKEISKEQFLTAKEEPKQVFKTDFDDANWYSLKVPGHWGMINDFSNYTGIGWYRKTISIPEGWTNASNNRYYLKFGGVYHLSKVYLNGKFIGKNRGGFTPFEFDVTDALNYNSKNVIAVQVDNSAIVGATWNWGGIIRDVTLTKNKDVRIDYQYIHADPDLKTGTAALKLKVKIENKSSVKRTLVVNAKVLDDTKIDALSGTIEVEANTTADIELESTLTANNVELWHFDHPKLYKIATTISEGEHILDARDNNFGIRKVELTGSKMLLNGEPVRLAGFNRVSEHRFWGSSEPLEVLEEDVDLLKEAGANFMRIMHGTQNEKLIDLCDKKGILLFEEVNVRDLDNDEFRAKYLPLAKVSDENSLDLKREDEEILMLDQPYVKVSKSFDLKSSADKNYLIAKYWLKGMIERDINHPSIIGWSVGNELNNHNAYAKEAIDYVKNELDPYRLVTCVSNSGQKDEYTPETDPNTHVDVIMHNMYRWQGQPQEILNTLREKWPDKPVFVSEYGFDPFQTTSPNADKAIFSEWMNHFRNKNKFVIGTSMWTFNDYRSGYAGTTAEENRVWGVITSWRQKRRLFNRLKKEHAPIHDIEITEVDFKNNTANFNIPIKSRSDYPSHSMKGYKLNYQFRNSKGEIVSKNTMDLPMLTPEDKVWSNTITWKSLPDDILDLTVSLITPTGYSRYDKMVSFLNPITPEISEVISGKNSARILFDKVPNAGEYFVSYVNDKGETIASDKTITNGIDVMGLTTGKTYSFKLYAVNDKGISNASKVKSVITNNNVLPPIIWDAFIAENKLIIGYSSDFEDGDYTVKYGASKTNLDKEFISNVRGMMSIDLHGENDVYFKLKRSYNSEESNWSQIVKAK
ncbi:glycoside hydrolase family 2 TIM barrel-domain containing protein [uncultured Algibacter sp.]|uniref:glycoside hydrolase family 2 TIM barrel-domain containing protein n=1 Tax=uncultured Algibacter sp. TaxID=298659 RepID=UPI00261DE995|nr:glycoside hydrolase family 2 TIM barrel-domain containing protein [uncultured Algibacter sp.]